jgi:integrase
MALTDTFIKQSTRWSGKPTGDKHTDGKGLYLHVKEAGKYWRMDYAHMDKRKTLALGVYPAVSLAQARSGRDEARKLLAQGIDPSEAKRQAKAQALAQEANTFEEVAREFHQNKAQGWSKVHAAKWLSGLKNYLFPALGKRPIHTINPPDLLAVLRLIEKRGILETAHTVKQNAGQVFRYGIQTGRCERNPAADLQGALKPVTVKHMAAIVDPVKAGELLRAIDGYTGTPHTRVAMALSALIFQRPGNVRQLEWSWVDLDKAMLTIPPTSMKRTLHGKANGRPHFVPLCTQAVALLAEIKPLTGGGLYVFPSVRADKRPMSENTVNAAMRRMGYTKDEMTAHGFRAMARTLIAEHFHGIDEGVIEAQLAHDKSGPLGAAYDRAEFMAHRVAMMQRWGDYLDKLRAGADVLPLHRAA